MPKLQISLPDGSEVSHDLLDETVTVGRLPDNNIQIDDVSVSSHHAQLTLSGGDYHLKDLNSTNGTRVNGKTVSEAQLHAGDKVRFGKIEVLYGSEFHHSEEKQELPPVEIAAVTPATSSQRPADFANASPFRTKKKKADPAGKAILALATVSILALCAAAAMVWFLQAPALPAL